MQYEIITENLDYKAIDFLSDFGGYLGLFIGASILYLYEYSINFILQIITKFKSRFGAGIRIGELKTETVKGQEEERKMNDKVFQLAYYTTSTPKNRISFSENENSKIQEELRNLHNKINILENKMHEDYCHLRKKIKKYHT